MKPGFPFFRRLDKAGRLVIPQDIRRALGVNPGDGLVLEMRDGVLLVRPVATTE